MNENVCKLLMYVGKKMKQFTLTHTQLAHNWHKVCVCVCSKNSESVQFKLVIIIFKCQKKNENLFFVLLVELRLKK